MVTTRRNAAASDPASQRESPPVEQPRKRGRKGKAPAALAEPQSQSQLHTHTESLAESSAKGRTAARVASSMATTATVVTGSVAATAPKRVTRAARGAGDFSPLQALPESEPKRQTEKKHKSKRKADHDPEPASAAPALDDDDSDQGMFFTNREQTISSSLLPSTPVTASSTAGVDEALRDQNANLVAALQTLQQQLAQTEQTHTAGQVRLADYETRLAEAEKQRAALEDQVIKSRADNDAQREKRVRDFVVLGRELSKCKTIISRSRLDAASTRSQDDSPLRNLADLKHLLWPPSSPFPRTPARTSPRDVTPFRYLPIPRGQQTPSNPRTPTTDRDVNDTSMIDFHTADKDQCSANTGRTDFDTAMLGTDDEPTPRPTFITGNKSALALLEKIEKNAKRTHDNSECGSDDGDAVRVRSPRSPPTSIANEQPTTPARAIATPSGFFSKSLSILKATLGFAASTPLPPPSPAPTPKPVEPLTELLSIPPTPTRDSMNMSARRRNASPLLRTLLRGIATEDLPKARQWARPLVQQLKADAAFRDKRTRLETPVLARDLKFYPSSKPWENGFGDPLSEFDDDDVVPVWAVYMSIVAEEDKDKHRTKRRRSTDYLANDWEVSAGSLNEQYPADNSTPSAPALHNTHGHSTSKHDFQPRRATAPSPMFDTPVVHQEGDNVFREQKGYDITAKIREHGRDTLQQQTQPTVGTHNPTEGSFSVPEGSDEEDASMTDETADKPGNPRWTQPPPPAPVPAHAPLPGGPPVDAPSVPAVQQPVDEVARQRQKLMKHTPAKPSGLRQAIFPSPSVMSDAGNESVLPGTPAFLSGASFESILASMPQVGLLDIDDDDLQAANDLVASMVSKDTATQWAPAIITYDSDEESVSPV